MFDVYSMRRITYSSMMGGLLTLSISWAAFT